MITPSSPSTEVQRQQTIEVSLHARWMLTLGLAMFCAGLVLAAATQSLWLARIETQIEEVE